MSKKSRRTKQPRKQPGVFRVPAQSPLFTQMIGEVQQLMMRGDFDDAIEICEPLLRLLPKKSSARVEVLSLLGLAHAMLQEYEESYDLFSEALTIDPANAELWYNHGLACRYTTRVGQAQRDFERAVELSKNTPGELADKCAQQLATSRRELAEAMEIYGGQISLDTYIEYEERFKRCMKLMHEQKWQEAEQQFRELLERGGRIPQYWGNLGVCLIMQKRYDEAEDALKQALAIDPEYPVARDNLASLPQIRHSTSSIEIVQRNLPQTQDISQSLTFYGPGEDGSGIVPRASIAQNRGTTVTTRQPLGKQPPHYSFFLNPYNDVRFTTCPMCHIKTRQRKVPLVIHIEPNYMVTLGKTCRYCVHCDLLIVHQDQLEEQLAGHMAVIHPEIIGNDYLVMGTLDSPEWRQGMQNQLSPQKMIEHLHDFKEVLTFKPVYY
jgi:tetratricopeptide (TPR) repeat protein